MRTCKPAETLRAAGTGLGAAAFTLAPDVFGIGGRRSISEEPEEVVPGIALATGPANFGGVDGEADEVTGIALATGTANLGGVKGEADELTGIVFATGPAMGGAEGDANVVLHGAFATDPHLGGVEGDTDDILVPVVFAGGPANAAGTLVIATLGPSLFLAAGTPPEARPVAPSPT